MNYLYDTSWWIIILLEAWKHQFPVETFYLVLKIGP